MNLMLKITEDMYNQVIINSAGFGETLIFGLEMLLLGMCAVFAVLFLIWGCLKIFSAVFTKGSTKSAKPSAEKTPVQTIVPQNTASQSDEIVAVIAAAIAMAENENNGTKFRVVSFKRK